MCIDCMRPKFRLDLALCVGCMQGSVVDQMINKSLNKRELLPKDIWVVIHFFGRLVGTQEVTTSDGRSG